MSSTILIQTAKSWHERCFVCGAKSRLIRLHKVSHGLVVDAYIRHRILVKSHARCCGHHLDHNGFLQFDEIMRIETIARPCSREIINMLDSYSERELTIFEKFIDFDNMTDEYCFEITGWNKITMKNFASYITSLNCSSTRTMYQLIALYRFWLRKGVDQVTLAKMFSKKTSQVMISKYLNQIRTAIYKDFVPFFLARVGAEIFSCKKIQK